MNGDGDGDGDDEDEDDEGIKDRSDDEGKSYWVWSLFIRSASTDPATRLRTPPLPREDAVRATGEEITSKTRRIVNAFFHKRSE